MANRSYSLPTIKTLFGQARTCARPDCDEPLIFEERGAKTVIAQIAHIRSEKPRGPRHDPTFTGDIDGPANLLLLCGKHHKPVDDHESLYSIIELEGWKRTQIAGAGAGTAISDAEAKRFAGLTPEERATIVQMAKLSSRVEIACTRARQSLNQVEAQRQEAVRIARSTFGPVYAVSDDGTKTLVTDQIQLSPIEQSQWRARADASLAIHQPAITEALDVLAEEVAVLRMMSPTLGGPAHVVLLAAQGAGDVVTSEAALEASLAVLQGAIQELWATASPD